MNEFIEAIKFNLNSIGELLEVVLKAFSLVFIIGGVIAAFAKSMYAATARRFTL